MEELNSSSTLLVSLRSGKQVPQTYGENFVQGSGLEPYWVHRLVVGFRKITSTVKENSGLLLA